MINNSFLRLTMLYGVDLKMEAKLMRSKFQLYLKGCDEAIELYKKAFDATVDAIYRDPESNLILHAEIKVFGQCVAFMERDTESVEGNTMQLSFEFENSNEEIIKMACRYFICDSCDNDGVVKYIDNNLLSAKELKI